MSNTLETLIEEAIRKQSLITGSFIKHQIDVAIQQVRSENDLDAAIKNGFTDLKEWVMTELGYPVIKINLDDAHYRLAFTSAVQLWWQHHYDGSHIEFIPIQVTQEMKDTKKITHPILNEVDKILDIKTYPSGYVNDVLFGSTFEWINDYKMDNYSMNIYKDIAVTNSNKQYSLTHFLSFEQTLANIQRLMYRPVIFRYHKAERYIDMMDVSFNAVSVGDLMVIECYRNVTVSEIADIMNEVWIKRYMTAKAKSIWGNILRMIRGVALIGNVTVAGDEIYSEAMQQITDLEQELYNKYEYPPMIYWG